MRCKSPLRRSRVMHSAMAEWVILSETLAIISGDTGEFWPIKLDDPGDIQPFGRPMTGKGTRTSTAALLDGAIALGFSSEEGYVRTASLPKYVLDLVGAYHNSRRTPGHFLQAAKRFRELDRP